MAYTDVIEGVRHSVNALEANLKPDWEKILFVLKPYQTPLTQWLWFYGKNPMVVKNKTGKFGWFEDEYFPHQTQLTGTGISGGASSEDDIGVDDTDIFRANDILYIEATGQFVYVDSVESDAIDITSMDGSTTLSAATSGYVKIVGNRNSETNTTPTALTTKEIEKYNYLNIFTESVKSSGRDQAGETWTDGTTHDEQVEKKIMELKLKMERYFLFAPSAGYATDSDNGRTTWGHGLLGRITTNVTQYAGGAVDESTLDEHFKNVFSKGSNRRIHMCGADQLLDINQFLKDRYELNPNPTIEMYGSDIREYITPFGRVNIMYNQVLDGSFAEWGFTIDPDHVKLRYMADDKKGSRKLRVEENVETPGTDTTETKILADVGMQLTNEETCGILKPA
jgi:hypothetical protein